MDLDALRMDAYCKVYKVLQLMGIGYLKREMLLSTVKSELQISQEMHREALNRLAGDAELQEQEKALKERTNPPSAAAAAPRVVAAAAQNAAASPVRPSGTGRGRGRPPANRDPPVAAAVATSQPLSAAPSGKLKRGLEPKTVTPAMSPLASEAAALPAKSKFAPPLKKQKTHKSGIAAAAPSLPPTSTPPISSPQPTPPSSQGPSPTTDPQLSLAYDERTFHPWLKRATEADMVTLLASLDTREREIHSEISRYDAILAAPVSPPPAPVPPPAVQPAAVVEPPSNGVTWQARPASKFVKEEPVDVPAAPPAPPSGPPNGGTTSTKTVADIAAADTAFHAKLNNMGEWELLSMLNSVRAKEEAIVDELLQLDLTVAEVDMLMTRLQSNLSNINQWEATLQTDLVKVEAEAVY